MKQTLIFSLCFCLLFCTAAFGQDILGMRSKAEDNFKAGDFSRAAYWLKQLKMETGDFKDSRLQYMLVHALYQTGHFVTVKNEAAAFFRLNPRKSSSEYAAVKKMLRTLPKKLKKDDLAFEKATQMTNISLLKAYLTDFPDGKYRKEVSEIIDDYYFDNARENPEALKAYIEQYPEGRHATEAREILDEETYKTAVDANTPLALAAYLRSFPHGKHAGEAQITLKGWAEAAYAQVKRTDTDSAYQYYLENFPEGQHYRQIENIYQTGKENRFFKKVKQSGKPEKYEEYLKKYPQGTFVIEAEQYLKKAWIQLGDQAFDLENYAEAQKYYTHYLRNFPLGKEQEHARQQRHRASKKLKRTSRKTERLNRFFVAYHADTAALIGASLGILSQRAPGFYMAARSNIALFKSYRYTFNNRGVNNLKKRYKDTQFSGKTLVQKAVATLGATQKIVNPVWIFAGGGVEYKQWLHEVVEKDGARVFGINYAVNTDEKKVRWVVETGLILDFGGFQLKGGMTGVEAKEWYPVFGLGFSFGYR